MRVLGIDPGTRKTGWGVVEKSGTRIRLIASGIVRTGSGKVALPQRLLRIHDALQIAISEHKPDEVALEDIFFAKYANAAMKLGHARGAAMLVAAQAGLRLTEYPPALVKRTVVGKGAATKDQVGRLVMVILGLKTHPGEDAADALAVALTHLMAQRVAPPKRKAKPAKKTRIR